MYECKIYNFLISLSAPCDLSDDDMSIVDTTDGDSINSNTLMVKDKRSKTGYKKASDRKVYYKFCDWKQFPKQSK